MSCASVASVDEGVFLQVHQNGLLTVVSFRENEPGPFFDWSDCRPELINLIEETGCRQLAFDLSDFDSFSSSLLSLLVCPVLRGVEVCVYGPTQHLVDLLKTTQLDHLIRVVSLENAARDGCEALHEAVRSR